MALPRRKEVYQDEEIIYHEGDPADGAYEVLTGSVELSRKDNRGGNTENFQAGQMFGEMGLVGGGVRESTARAIGPVQVRLISRDSSSCQSDTAVDKVSAGGVMEKMSDAIASDL